MRYLAVVILVVFSLAPARIVNVANSSQLNTAIAAIQPGDTVLLAAGVYAEFDTDNKDGAVNAWIVIKAVPGALVTINTTGEGFWHYGKYWIFEGLRFNGNGGVHIFHLKPSARGYLVWRGCHFFNCSDKAVKVDGSYPNGPWTDYMLMENCTMQIGYAGLMNNDGGDYLTCRGNYTYGFLDGGVYYVYFSKGGMAYSLFENNLAWGGKRGALSFGGGSMGVAKFRHADDLGAGYAPTTFETYNSICRNNVVIGTVEAAFSSSTAKDCEFYNNTIIDCNAGLWFQAHHGPGVGLHFYNNLLIRTATLVQNDGAFITKTNNKSLNTDPATIFQDYRPASPSTGDFRIKPAMAATVGTGKAPNSRPAWLFYEDIYGPQLDYYGNPRGTPPLIGATEVYTPDAIDRLPDITSRGDVSISVSPNPANRVSILEILVKKDRKLVDVLVCDIGGRHVRTLYYGPMPAGVNTVAWDLKDHNIRFVPSGAYVYRVNLGREVLYKKLQVAR